MKLDELLKRIEGVPLYELVSRDDAQELACLLRKALEGLKEIAEADPGCDGYCPLRDDAKEVIREVEVGEKG